MVYEQLIAGDPKMQYINGLGINQGNLSRLSMAQSRSISPENFTGEAGYGGMATAGTGQDCARELGQGWKMSPSIDIAPGACFTLAEISGAGAIQHMWMTPAGRQNRFYILRIYYEDQEFPSVEVPLGDFFAMAWPDPQKFSQLNSAMICYNPGNAFNCYWEIPFRRKIRITMTNIDTEPMRLYYQIDYTLAEVPENCAYFCAQFRRVNPLPYKDVYTILDGVQGHGHYVGTYLAWGVNNNGWWGEGEIKFFIDDDREFPTICGTGTEDYFCGSYNFEDKTHKQYQSYTTLYAGLPQVIRPDGLYISQQRFGMYRWHVVDPVRFRKELKVTIQALGWHQDGRYLPLQDDISSVAYWYQTLPVAPFPTLPNKDMLEII